MDNKEKLLPCPFCGGEAEIVKWHNAPAGHFVDCNNIDCEVQPQHAGRTKGLAITAWNTRTQPTANESMQQWIDHHNARADKAEKTNEELIAALEAGWSLSTWAACINWDGSRNEKEWLDELRLLIEDFQKKYEGATNA